MSEPNPSEPTSAAAIGRRVSMKRKNREKKANTAEAAPISESAPITEEGSAGLDAHATDIIDNAAKDESVNKYVQDLVGDVADLDLNKGQNARLELLKLTITCAADNVTHEYAAEKLDSVPIRIKEDVEFDITLDVKIYNDFLVGLRYSHILKKMGIKVDEATNMIGSYPPKKSVQQLTIKHIQAPKGLLGRGKYKVNSALTDDQEIAHKEWNWTLQITKNWDSDE